jgi:hypothetical protein
MRVKDRPRIDNGFPRPENILHGPLLAIGERDNQRRDLRIGAHDIDTIEPRSGGHPLGVDGEVPISSLALGPEEAVEALVASAQGIAQSGKNRLTGTASLSQTT